MSSAETFLEMAWANIVDNKGAWLEAYAGAWPMNQHIKALLAAGVDKTLLTKLVRSMQFDLLMNLCTVLDEGKHWRLFEIDEAGKPVKALISLHEHVLGTDPTGEADAEAWA